MRSSRNCDGTKILPTALNGKSGITFQSGCRWPRQGQPPTAWWSLWKRKLQMVFSNDGRSAVLRQNLGAWNSNTNNCEWSALFDEATGRAFVKDTNNSMYEIFKSEGNLRKNTRVVSTGESASVDVIPASATPALAETILGGSSANQRITTRKSRNGVSTVKALCFNEFVKQQQEHIQSALSDCDLSDESARTLADMIYGSQQLFVGTDGGAKSGVGTFGFVWGDKETRARFCRGSGKIPASASRMTSTRAELWAIFVAMSYLRLVKEYFNIVPPKDAACRACCDSKVALRRIEGTDDHFSTTWRCRPDYDLESAVRKCITNLNGIKVQWLWVKGHAKRKILSWNETLNEEADSQASMARSLSASRECAHWPEQLISLKCNKGVICGRLAKDLRSHCTANDIRSYWKGRYNWSTIELDSVDTIGLNTALGKVSWKTKKRIQKLRCGWLPVNARESKIDPDCPNGCSACSTSNLVIETVEHIYQQCNAPSRRSAIRARLADLKIKLSDWKTSPIITKAIIAGAEAWIEGKQAPTAESIHLPRCPMGKLVRYAIAAQTDLGWNAFFRGFLPTDWRNAQEAYQLSTPSKGNIESGEKWLCKLLSWIFELFDLVWGLRNKDEHGAEPETQRLIKLAKCERAIRRLYEKSISLLYCERHPFR